MSVVRDRLPTDQYALVHQGWLRALQWALEDAADVPPALVALLTALACEVRTLDGRVPYPDLLRLAHRTRRSVEDTLDGLLRLEQLGLVCREQLPDLPDLPPGQLPVLYRLALDTTRPPLVDDTGGHR